MAFVGSVLRLTGNGNRWDEGRLQRLVATPELAWATPVQPVLLLGRP